MNKYKLDRSLEKIKCINYYNSSIEKTLNSTNNFFC